MLKHCQKFANQIQKEYADKFKKYKDFFTAKNSLERGMVAFLYRSSDTEGEFERRKNLTIETIDKLKNGDKKEIKMAEILEENGEAEMIDAQMECVSDISQALDKYSQVVAKIVSDSFSGEE